MILSRLWKQNESITEQAVGHTLQHLLTLTEKLTARKKRLNQLEAGHHNSPPPKQA